MCLLEAVRCKGRLEKKTEVLLHLHLEQCGTSKKGSEVQDDRISLAFGKDPFDYRVESD